MSKSRQKSNDLFEKAKNSIPGGVNSPVRAFRAVGGHPVFVESANGPFLQDVDGNKYIDLISSWGPMLFGHAHKPVLEALKTALPASVSFGAPTHREVEMAELIVSMVPSVEKVRMVNSGTEATMSALRVARGFTGRDKFIKFEGCYHGHGDSFLISAGSGAITHGNPDSPGVTKGVAEDTISVIYNDLNAVEAAIAKYPNQIAAIIIEPVAGNMGCVVPEKGYLQGLRQLCDQHGILLIFDEVMTGFRLAKGGAQEYFNVMPDLTTLGKIIGGGLPVGAYGGRKDIMDKVSPAGPIYQAGTLSGNPLAMAAGLAMLTHIKETPEVYQQLENTTTKIVDGIRAAMKKHGLNYTINQVGSMYSLFFTDQPVRNFTEARAADLQKFSRYFNSMLNQGVYLAPSQFESLFVSAAITDELVEQMNAANMEALSPEVLEGND